jgi:hypothetical protein
MIPIQTALDIANRALDHCGQDPIGPTGFLEQSKKARLMARLYNNLRRTELRRRVWTFSTMRTVLRPLTINTMKVSPTLWSPAKTYYTGSIVSDVYGVTWSSNIPNNLNQEPGSSFAWDFYAGPTVVFPYDPKQTYWAGELVYIAPGDGNYKVYRSKVSANVDNPATPTTWDATTVFNKNQIVLWPATVPVTVPPTPQPPQILYMSLINLNQGQQPDLTSAMPWNSGVTYSAGQTVRGSDGFIYSSQINGNVNHNPVADLGTNWLNTHKLAAWASDFVGGTGSAKWLEVACGLEAWDPVYPVGAGPDVQSQTLNAFAYPANFLREAPQDPRAGSTSYLGAAWGLNYDDYKYENGTIVSWKVDPIIYRFVSDFVDVRRMDPDFIEGLAFRMALDAVEPLTQSVDKKKVISAEYEKFMGEAGIVNGIEGGPVEPPIDDYIACRG